MSGLWEDHIWCVITVIILLLIIYVYCWKELPWYYLGLNANGQPVAMPTN